MFYRFYLGMIVLKWKNEESDESISWKRNVKSEREREPSKSSLMCSMHFKPNDFVRSLDFKEEEGILRTPWLEQDEFGKILRNSSQSAQATCRNRRLENSELIFFWANVFCLDMFKFPSLVNSWFEREIWKGNFGRIQFLSKSCCEQRHWFGRHIV